MIPFACALYRGADTPAEQPYDRIPGVQGRALMAARPF